MNGSGQQDEMLKFGERLAARGEALNAGSMPDGWELVDVRIPMPPLHRRAFIRLLGWFRRRRLARSFSAFGRGSTLARPCWIRGARSIAIAERVTIWTGARLNAINAEEGREIISIGAGTALHPNAHVAAARRVRIGRDVLIASNCFITDHDHDWLDPSDPPRTNARIIVTPTTIEDRVWIGERVSILRGVTVGASSVVGAGSVVTSDIPPYSVAVGAPARVIRRWDPDLGAWIRVD